MKGGAENTDLEFSYDGKKIIPYQWGDDRMGTSLFPFGRGYGFFIRVRKDDNDKDDKRFDFFVDVSGSKDNVHIVKIEKQSGTADTDPAIDDAISKFTDAENKSNPVETIQHLLPAGKDFYVFRFEDLTKQTGDPSLSLPFKSKSNTAPLETQAPAPVVETPEAPVAEVVEPVIKQITQLVSTENEEGVNVLKSIGPVKITDVNDGKIVDDAKNNGSERLHRNNIQNVLCKKISEGLNNDPDLSKEFNKTEADADLEKSENVLAKKKDESAWESFADLKKRFETTQDKYTNSWNTFKNLYDEKYFQQEGPLKILNDNIGINFNTNMNTLKIQLPQDKTQFDSSSLMANITNNPEFTDELKTELNKPISSKEKAIQKQYQAQQELKYEQEKLYKLVYAINEVMKKSKVKLDEYNNNYTVVMKNTYGTVQEPVLVSKILKREIHPQDVLKKLNPNFPKEILMNYKSNMNISLSKLTHNSGRDSKNTLTEMSVARKRLGKSIRNLTNTDFSGISSSIKNTMKNIQNRTSATTGGKRKTRKNKARKTRRKVQRKRRQSKKH